MNNDVDQAGFTLTYPFEGQIYFYCCEGSYPHLSICIAEGLKQLGIPFYSNINYWQIDADREDYLFCHSPSVTPADCDIVVVERAWIEHYKSLPENLFQPGRDYITVYLDDMDGPITPAWYPAFRNFDFIFRTHFNSRCEYPTNFIPWVFGLSNRILKETRNIPDFHNRNWHLLANFRVSQEKVEVLYFEDTQAPLPPGMVRIDLASLRVEHPLRQMFRNELRVLIEPILPVNDTVDYFNQPPSDSYHYWQWQQTGQRHYPNYYQRLRTTSACAAFGGYLVPLTDGNNPYVEWWDSWRFWESLAAGCVTFHVDFDKYGIRLPIMPENWRHYIGIDLDNLEDAVQRIANDPGLLERISISGRQWAIDNYSPVPTAIRFLETISGNLSQEHRALLNKDNMPTPSVPIQLSEINLIIFPDWSQEEEALYLKLKQVIRALATHPDKRQMALLIDTSNISQEDADIAITGVLMNLLMEEDLEVEEGLEISLVGQLGKNDWEAVLPHIHARIILEKENEQAMPLVMISSYPQAIAETFPSYELDSFSQRRAGEFFFHLGNKLFQEGRWQGAIEQYHKILEIQIGNAEIYTRLSECFRQLNLPDKTISILQEGIQVYPTTAQLHFSLILNLQRIGRIEEAISRANTASNLMPNEYVFKIFKNLLIPAIYDTYEEIGLYRQQFTKGLQNLVHKTILETAEERENALAGISRLTNFYLSYQAQNDIELQRQYGNLVYKIMVSNYPEWDVPLSMHPLKENNKIRIGYASAYLHSYSGTLWLTGWLRHYDRQNFEIYCYYTGNTPDPITQQFQEYSDVFHHIPHNLEAVCQQIIADQLHILVFPEIGMDAQTMQIAALRLAPVQCSAWGHPVTSGLPTIDYFLSSELMEPENAQNHYSERLIRLPNIGVSYPKPYIPPYIKTRADFGLQDDAIIYLCCQAPFKYLPQYDFIFAEIARRVPQAQFVFLRGSILKPRLSRAFAAVGLKSEDYCTFLTIPERLDYLMINLLSDVYLDTFCWSGGNTTLEAIACNLPIVTCPGEFMRGRHSYSFLKMLGVTDTIAQNEQEYIEIAVKLGLDPAWRRNISERINESHDRLFDDQACVAGLEAFYKQVVREGRMSLCK